VHIAVVNLDGSPSVRLVSGTDETEDTAVDTVTADPGEEGVLEDNPPEAAETAVSKDPGPIVPELKELAWGAGSFIVLALLMRFAIYPKLKRGMDARYEGIRGAHEGADRERAAARAEVADYEAQLAAVRTEAAGRVEAARATLEGERQAAITQLNARLAEQRAQAQAQVDAARAAVRDQIESAVVDVAGRAGELATGRRPDAAVVQRAVSEVMAR
jgi:F-type H+-transporting ATPase subunit b